MKTTHLFIRPFLSLILAASVSQAALPEAEEAMQAREFSKAAELLAKEKGDDAAYLKAVAEYQLEDYAKAEATTAQLLADFPDSDWRHKARFLHAKALVAQKKHKEAEAVYSAEADRIFSSERKERIARLLIKFADELSAEPDPDDLAALPPDHAKALELYKQVLELEIVRPLRDEITYKAAVSRQKLGQHKEAAQAFREYLAAFDPTWAGPVGSPERTRGQLKKNPKPAGEFRLQARYGLAVEQNLLSEFANARQNADDLIALIARETPDDRAFLADAQLVRIRTYEGSGTPDQQVDAKRAFLAAHPNHEKSPGLSASIGETFAMAHRADDAVAAHEDFIAEKNYRFTVDDDATTPDPKTGISPAEALEVRKRKAFYTIGQLRYNQKRYGDAIAQFEKYIVRYPNGAQWASAQSAIINAKFQLCLDAVAEGEDAVARKRFDEFLSKYPLDDRSRQILFTLGQMHVATADALCAANPDTPLDRKRAAYQKAIDAWAKLISKYPNTEESSLALYQTAVLQSEKTGQLEEALASFRRLTWGSWAAPAKGRVTLLSEESLGVATERTFRTDEQPQVAVTARNIRKLKVSVYPLNIESYFRKRHELGRIDHLDIDLIQPDRTWEVEMAGFKKYERLVQHIDIPFEGGKPGIRVVKIEGGDWAATTLVVRSDIDIILKSSRREALVYVEDQRRAKPAQGAKLLFSDGKRIFGTGETAADGVYRARFDELKTVDNLRVLAIAPNGAASNMLNIGGLQFSSGLTERGYIYTGKPAYRPGEEVNFRGVLREVVDGVYAVPENRAWRVRITDPAGRLLRESEIHLSDYGTFHSSVDLPTGAPQGDYVITASEVKGRNRSYTGNFKVDDFALRQIELAFDFPQRVYFRGEKIEGTLAATYYWGAPAADQTVQISLPDGRTLSEKTDAEGKLPIVLETSGFQQGRALNFTATLPAFDVSANKSLFLAHLGYAVRLVPDQPLVLADENFEVAVRTKGADGKPVGREVTVTVLRSEQRKSNPVLEWVPWINHTLPPAAQVTAEEHKVTTDPETGEAKLTLNLDKGGHYTLRASGEDRFGQSVTGQVTLQVSDDEDAQKLRFFADKTTWDVGSKIPLRLHSRVEKQLALLTYEGEEILHHEIISIKKGDNRLEARVEHAHFPNFRVSVALIDDRTLRAATKRFNVKRELLVKIVPAKDVFAPGAPGEFEIEATDQQGNAVEAELSLALVNEAVYAAHADGTPPIVSFFQKGARRYTEFRIFSTCAFQYTARSKKRVSKSGAALVRYADFNNDIEQLVVLQGQELGLNRGNSALSMMCSSNHISVFNGAVVLDQFAPQQQEAVPVLGEIPMFGNIASGQRSGITAIQSGNIDGLLQTNALFTTHQTTGPIMLGEEFYARPQVVEFEGFINNVVDASGKQSVARAMRWIPSVETNMQGKATFTIDMPESAGQWRLTARGCTEETLVGQATEKVITRRDFFADLRLPSVVQEGDVMELLATIHNLTDYEGEAELHLVIEGGEPEFRESMRVDIAEQGSTEAVFDAITIPFAHALRFTLQAKAGDQSHVFSRVVPVRPWGLEYGSYAAGVTSNGAGAVLELPAGQNYTNRKLLVTLTPSVEQALIDLALDRTPGLTPLGQRGFHCEFYVAPETPESQLLAAASALKYARLRSAPLAEVDRLRARTASLVSAAIVSQTKEGAWAWNGVRDSASLESTATMYWGLAEAAAGGIPVHPDTLAKAKVNLDAAFAKLHANDHDAKAAVVHALSVSGDADFTVANRLYRERNRLSEAALAHMAAAFARMGREGFARDLLALLERKARTDNGQVWWKGSATRPLLRNRAETTALALFAYARVSRASNFGSRAAQFVLREATRPNRDSGRSLGALIAGLGEYHSQGPRLEDDFEVAITVNDTRVHTVRSDTLRHTRIFAVPAGALVAGKNRVRIDVRGRGEVGYAASLSGFSDGMKDPESWRYPIIENRNYYHDKLSYRDVRLDALSSSPVKRIETGQRIRVRVNVGNDSSFPNKSYLTMEEHLPAGMLFVENSAKGNFRRLERIGSKLLFHFVPGNVGDVVYELVANAPGNFRMLPTVIRDATDRGSMRLGKPHELRILKPGVASDDPYQLNRHEHFEFATKLFEDGDYDRAQQHLDALFDNPEHRRHYEKDLARMLLWIHTSRDQLDAKRIVEMFEVLHERHPDLVIPFDRILTVGHAYREIGEFESAWLIARAAIYSSFLSDARISVVLENQGRILGSVQYQEDLWRAYPDNADVLTAHFALSQFLFQKAPEARAIALQEKRLREKRGEPQLGEDEEAPEKIAMLERSRHLLHTFLTLYATDPLADEAAFSEVNAFFALKDYGKVVRRAELAIDRHPKSEFRTSFQYMAALGHFWQRHYKEALASAGAVAGGESKDRDYARYIMAQIHHATGKPAEALVWYEKVREKYPDAGEAIAYFEQKKIGIAEASTFKPGEAVELEIAFRNVREAALQVYKVDLLKLYLREKNLSNITKVDLAGIDPEAELTVTLGDGKDYRDKTKRTTLPVKDEGAYLVICRGDDLFTSGLVLVTPLKLEIQENADEGSVRVNVRSSIDDGYQPEVLVKVVGSGNGEFLSGETDLRGVFHADTVHGTATVLAKSGDNNYAFYRGNRALGKAPEKNNNKPANEPAAPQQKGAAKRQLEQSDYLENVVRDNQFIQDFNFKKWDTSRQNTIRGVEMKKAK